MERIARAINEIELTKVLKKVWHETRKLRVKSKMQIKRIFS